MHWSHAVIAVAVAGATSTTAQSPQQGPTLGQATAEVVMVDVGVVDRDGRPVTDLRREEFELREEGRPQAITQFERLQLQVAASEWAPRPRVSTNTGLESSQPKASLVILFDQQNLRPEELSEARKAVLHVLDSGLGIGDELMLLASGRREHWRARDPVGLEALRAHVAELKALHVRSADEELASEAEAMQIAVYRDQGTENAVALRIADTERAQGRRFTQMEMLNRDESLGNRARNLADRIWAEASQRARATLTTIEGISRLLAARPGRKSVVLVTDGFVTDGRWDEWKRTLEAARRANVVVYAIDARGQRPAEGLSADTGRTATGTERHESALRDRETSEGSDSLVSETGGFTRRYANDLGEALARIATESRNYYLLGFVPQAPPDGKYRRLTVAVHRPGLTVRARKGYLALAAGDAGPPRPGPIPLRLAAFVLEPQGEAVHVEVVGEIDPGAIRFEEGGGRFTAAIEWLADVFTPGRRQTESPKRLRLSLAPETLASLRAAWVPVGAEFVLPAGTHVARLFVRDSTTDRVGTVEHVFEVPAPRAPYVSAVLSDLGQAAGAAPAFVARRTFAAGGQLLYQFEVHNVSAGGGPRQLVASYELRTIEGAVLSRGEDSPLVPGAGGRVAKRIPISLANVVPGRYEIRLQVRDERGAAHLEWTEPFEVIASAAPAH